MGMPHNPKLSDWSDEQDTLGGQSDNDEEQDDNNAGDQEAGDDE